MALPELIDDAIAEILIRLPPDEPACLVRASVVCKPWRRLLSDPAFLRRYREFHRAPPLLGFLRNLYDGYPHFQFIPTATASPFSTPVLDGLNLWALDCRHGRVLLNTFGHRGRGVVVWDPVTGDQQSVPKHAYPSLYYNTAAVICGTDGCDHLDCHGGSFRVVFVGFCDGDEDQMDRWWVSMYSSETGASSATSTIQCDGYVEPRPSVLSKDALYFSLDRGTRILKYDLIESGLSMIDAPDVYEQPEGIVVTWEDGGLGFAGVKDDSMYLWSWQVGFDGVSGWVQGRVIKLKTLLPIFHLSDSFDVIGFAEGTDTIFISTDVGVFTIMLKSGKVRKVGERGSYHAIIPYTSFYTSDLATGRLPLP